MKRLLALVVALSAACALLVAPGMSAAAQKSMCANGQGWELLPVGAATDLIWPALLDTSPWGGDKTAFAAWLDGAYDGNDDGLMCVQTAWGEALNPNAKWYRVGIELIGSPTQTFTPQDNNSNGSS